MKKYSELVGDRAQLNGKKTKIEDIIGKELTINRVLFLQSKQHEGQYALIEAEIGQEKILFNTGSGVLMKQLKDVENKVPFIATIKKVESGKGRKYFMLN